MEDAALAEDRVAGEADSVAQREAEEIGRVAAHSDRAQQRADRIAVTGRHRARQPRAWTATSPPSPATSPGTAPTWSA